MLWENYDVWIEKDRADKPKAADYVRVDSLLREFGIHVSRIPEFNSVADLERWQRKKILSGVSEN